MITIADLMIKEVEKDIEIAEKENKDLEYSRW